MTCIEGKGGGKDIHCSAQNAALFFIYHKISFTNSNLATKIHEYLIHIASLFHTFFLSNFVKGLLTLLTGMFELFMMRSEYVKFV